MWLISRLVLDSALLLRALSMQFDSVMYEQWVSALGGKLWLKVLILEKISFSDVRDK